MRNWWINDLMPARNPTHVPYYEKRYIGDMYQVARRKMKIAPPYDRRAFSDLRMSLVEYAKLYMPDWLGVDKRSRKHRLSLVVHQCALHASIALSGISFSAERCAFGLLEKANRTLKRSGAPAAK